jgi:hypothetical protein
MPTKKKKPAKKVVKKTSLVKHEPNIKAIISLFVLLVAFGVFILFYNNQDILLSSPSLKFFLALVVVLAALLIGLLFLINPQKRK